MKQFLLIILLGTVCTGTQAQDWQTVRVRDTNFYNAGRSLSDYAYSVDSNLLRAMWIDSASVHGSDSIYHFFRGIRADTSYINNTCMDTLGPSWLGSHMIRKPDGTELYFNSKGDTIMLMTKASPGTSWKLAKDIAGIIYQGTITSADIRNVDGTSDSVKTISIQALNNGAPVADPYNTMIFQISKQHGWIKTLDLYRFPNKLPNVPLGLLSVSSRQHDRLPKRFGTWDVQHVDLAWKYAAGNEFITTINHNPGGRGTYDDKIVTHDSIINAVFLSPSEILVTFQTRLFSRIWHYDLPNNSKYPVDSTAYYTHTDTIRNAVFAQPVRSFPLYESTPMLTRPNYFPSGFNRHTVDTVCGRRLSYEAAHFEVAYTYYNNCWHFVGFNSTNWNVSVKTFIEDFGLRHEYNELKTTYTPLSTDMQVTFAKLPGCTWGQKINVSTLGVNHTTPQAGVPFTVYPNPAGNHITVASALSPQSFCVTLRNISGQIVYEQNYSAQKLIIPTVNISSGLYFLEMTGKETHQNIKVLVQH